MMKVWIGLLILVLLHKSWAQLLDEEGLNMNSGWPPEQNPNLVRLARDLKTQFFSTLTGDKQQQQAAAEGGRRDRITALFIKLMTRLFRQRPFQRLLCGSNATCLANLNTPTY